MINVHVVVERNIKNAVEKSNYNSIKLHIEQMIID